MGDVLLTTALIRLRPRKLSRVDSNSESLSSCTELNHCAVRLLFSLLLVLFPGLASPAFEENNTHAFTTIGAQNS